jgi:capsular polysaccharide biosynthesis protein
MYEKENENSIDIKEIIRILKKRIVPILVIPIIFSIIGWLISYYLIEPVYESSTTIIVRQNKNLNEEINKSDVDLSKSLIYTYTEMAKSNTVLENTKKMLNLTDLKSESITVSPVKDTQILKVTVQNTDPILATDIANTLVEEFTKEIMRITKTDNVAVVDYAKIPKFPIKPNKIMNIIIAAVLGEIIIIFLCFLKEYLDNTLKSEKEIKKYLELSVIGSIPNFNQGSNILNEKND